MRQSGASAETNPLGSARSSRWIRGHGESSRASHTRRHAMHRMVPDSVRSGWARHLGATTPPISIHETRTVRHAKEGENHFVQTNVTVRTNRNPSVVDRTAIPLESAASAAPTLGASDFVLRIGTLAADHVGLASTYSPPQALMALRASVKVSKPPSDTRSDSIENVSRKPHHQCRSRWQVMRYLVRSSTFVPHRHSTL